MNEHGRVNSFRTECCSKRLTKTARVEAVVAPEQHAEHERREGVGRDQPGSLRSEECEDAAVAEDEEELRRRELHEDDAEDEKQARVAQKGVRLIDPELRQRGREKEKRDDEILRRLRLLAAEDEKREPGDEGGEDRHLHAGRVFEAAQQLIRGATAAGLARGETALHEAGFVCRKSNMRYFRADAAGIGRRSVLLVGVDDRANQLVPDDIAVVEINERNPGHILQRLERLDQAGAFVRRADRFGCTSPVTTHFEFGPMRVRSMNICSVVVFCASSRMTKALLSVRPRM